MCAEGECNLIKLSELTVNSVRLLHAVLGL